MAKKTAKDFVEGVTSPMKNDGSLGALCCAQMALLGVWR